MERLANVTQGTTLAKSNIGNNYNTEFSVLIYFVVRELFGLKTLIYKMFLKFENEQLVKHLSHLHGENSNEVLTR